MGSGQPHSHALNIHATHTVCTTQRLGAMTQRKADPAQNLTGLLRLDPHTRANAILIDKEAVGHGQTILDSALLTAPFCPRRSRCAPQTLHAPSQWSLA